MRIVLTTTTGRKSIEKVSSIYVGPHGSSLYVTTTEQHKISRIATDNIIDMTVEFTDNVNKSKQPTEEKTK